MTRKILFVIIIINCSLGVFSQSSVIQLTKTDSVRLDKVLIIPLNPKLYFSDTDHALVEYNNRTSDQLLYRWRSAIDVNVTVYMMAARTVHSMLMDTSWDVVQDIKAIYDGVSYGYEKSTNVKKAEEEKDSKFINKLKNKVSDMTKSEEGKINHPTAGEIGKPAEEIDEFMFMNVKMARPEMLEYYSQKYECDQFLFITQFELRTIYKEHSDRWTNKFTRQVAIHYALYNKKSKLMEGDVVRVNFNSNTNDLETIIRNTLPYAGQQISEGVY